jgi:hypothetical protein
MEEFYTPFAEVRARKFDGFIITGAPIELLEFEEVTYWDELTQVFDWTQTHVQSTFAICWGAQAMLHHFHGVPKHTLDAKAFGCFRHRNCAPGSPYLRGFSDDFTIPVSRWERADERARDRAVHDRGSGPPGALYVQPYRIRHHLAGRGVPARCGQRHADQAARELLSRRRPGQHAGEPLAQPCASAVRELD